MSSNNKEDVIVQHCFGLIGTGGPRAGLEKLLRCSNKEYILMIQEGNAKFFGLGTILYFVFFLIKNKPDLVHVRGLGAEGFWAILACKLARVKICIVSVHGSHRDLVFFKSNLKKSIVVNVFERLTLSLADKVVCVSEVMSRRKFINKFEYKLLSSIPNGVYLPVLSKCYFSRTLNKQSVPCILIVSRVTEDKGFGILFDALVLLESKETQLKLIVAGSVDNQSDIYLKFLQYGFKYINIQFLGVVENVKPLYEKADIFILPSLHENFSNALVEAMSYGLPIISSCVGDNEIILNNGAAGLLYPSNDYMKLAASIECLSSKIDLGLSLGRIARKRAEDFYTVSSVTQQWEAVYDDLLKKI